MRRYVNEEAISINKLKKQTEALVRIIETKIFDLLTDRLCLVFDGCMCGSTHYIGVFATYSTSFDTGFGNVLLAFSPVEDETNLAADELKKILRYTLSVFGKEWFSVVVVIEGIDNDLRSSTITRANLE
eukprot:IDg11483t1